MLEVGSSIALSPRSTSGKLFLHRDYLIWCNNPSWGFKEILGFVPRIMNIPVEANSFGNCKMIFGSYIFIYIFSSSGGIILLLE